MLLHEPVLRLLDGPYVLEQARFSTNANIIVLNFEHGFKQYPQGTNPLSFITQSDEASSRRCAASRHPASGITAMASWSRRTTWAVH